VGNHAVGQLGFSQRAQLDLTARLLQQN
jgi:hypothetical protein